MFCYRTSSYWRPASSTTSSLTHHESWITRCDRKQSSQTTSSLRRNCVEPEAKTRSSARKSSITFAAGRGTSSSRAAEISYECQMQSQTRTSPKRLFESVIMWVTSPRLLLKGVLIEEPLLCGLQVKRLEPLLSGLQVKPLSPCVMWLMYDEISS